MTWKVLTADVWPDFENVRVMSYVPGAVGVPATVVPFAVSQDAPEMVTEHPDGVTVGLKDHAEPTMPYWSGVPDTDTADACQTA